MSFKDSGGGLVETDPQPPGMPRGALPEEWKEVALSYSTGEPDHCPLRSPPAQAYQVPVQASRHSACGCPAGPAHTHVVRLTPSRAGRAATLHAHCR